MEKFFWVLMESQEKSVISALEKAKRIGVTAVSYTHLDVYKRQVPTRKVPLQNLQIIKFGFRYSPS